MEKINLVYDMPQLLADELNKDKILKEAFYQFTPGKQKEFMEYITYASQEATKLKRLKKIKPMILNNVGLKDNIFFGAIILVALIFIYQIQ